MQLQTLVAAFMGSAEDEENRNLFSSIFEFSIENVESF
jgi:hypothetical protein